MNFELSGDTLKITGSGTISSIDSKYYNVIKVIVEGEFTKIGDDVFKKLTSMEVLVLPDSVTYVGNFLLGKTKVKTFHIPFSLSSISEKQPFDQADYLEEFTIDPNHMHYAVVDGVLYSKDMKTLICYPGGKKGSVFTIPDEITYLFDASIGKNSFLTHVIVPSTVVGASGFGYLSSITNVTLFRCSRYDEKDEFLDGFDKNFKCQITTKITPYQYSLNENGSILTVYPMKGCHYSRRKFISFDNESSFINDTNLEEVIFHGRFNSTAMQCFAGCSNLKKIKFPNHDDICLFTLRQRNRHSHDKFLLSLIT